MAKTATERRVHMGDKNGFARGFGFEDWEAMMESSEAMFEEGDITWFVTGLPDGRYAAWDDAELTVDRVSIFPTEHQARRYQEFCYEEALGIGEEVN